MRSTHRFLLFGLLCLLCCFCWPGASLRADVAISEFMAVNTGALRDQDGDSSDWIEVFNSSTTPASLAGWSLTDTAGNPRKWLFPATNLAANSYLVVFASGKNRAVAGAELHTNFKLKSEGQYLALVDPYTNIATQFAPAYPPQVANVSYGLAKLDPPRSFVTNGTSLRYFVPTDNALGTHWLLPGFNDASWPSGTNAAGYEVSPGSYAGLIHTDVKGAMLQRSPSCLLRIPFVVTNTGDLYGWMLRLQVDAGCVAWLNGEEIIRYFAPDNLAWNSLAASNRTPVDVLAGEVFNLAEFESLVVPGTNLLAIHALSAPIDNPRFLINPLVSAKSTLQQATAARYFTIPTPGKANGNGVQALGPILSELAHAPAVPNDADDLVVAVQARPAFSAITNVTLHYRTMFSNEVAAPMFDDGAHADGTAGDGVFGAVIPAGASRPGQMVRYYITALDNLGRNSRQPMYLDSQGSPQYQGTVVRDPAIVTPLPVYHLFVQNTSAADTATGTRCSLFYDGEFHDNVFIRIRGGTARSWPKRSYKIEFNEGDSFRFRPDMPRVTEIDLNGTYTDKSYARSVLSSEFTRQSGFPAPEVFHVHLRQNAAFFSVALFVEMVDTDFLRRWNFDPQGALYKAQGDALGTYEKKTRKTENNADLLALLNAASTLKGTALENYVFDNFNVPGFISYMAAVALRQDIDATDKNHYLYQDTLGSREWMMLPWDLDLTFGPNALNTDTIVYNQQDTNAPACASHPFIGARPYMLHANKYNRLIEAIVNTPRTRAMLLCRIRTLTDQFLAPAWFTDRINTLVPLLQKDVDSDHTRWGGNAHFSGITYTLRQANDRIISEYLTPRLSYLTGNTIAGVGSANPSSQPPLALVHFAAAETNPRSGAQDQEYLCLTNRNSFAVDLTGWKVRGDITFDFKPGTVIPAAGPLYLSPNVSQFRARVTGPRGGQGLFVQGNYDGNLSARGGTVRLFNDYDREIDAYAHPAAPSLPQQFLRVTELMYHPAPPPAGGTNTDDDFEFVELRNISPDQALDLAGVRFTDGLQFSFSAGAVATLAPGARVLVVANRAAFTNRYPSSLPIAGEHTGRLDNSGERIRLVDALGEDILDFSYDNRWYPITDGLGFSLVIQDDTAPWNSWGFASSWRPGGALSGSPGMPDTASPAIAPVRINEVLTAPVTLNGDAIELFNPASTNVDLSGWWLSDNLASPKKYRIPNGRVIGPGAYAVFTEADFNPGGAGFALDSQGDDVWLCSADAAGQLTGYAHGFSFGPAEPGVSFGRYLTSLGEEHYVPQSMNTLGTNNAGPRVGPVVLSEIMYHPPDLVLRAGVGPVDADTDNGRDEFIELRNLAATNIALAGWRLRNAVDFDFPSNAVLAAGASLLVVGFDPETDTDALAGFRASYGLGLGIGLLGPWSGKLANSGDTLELRQPVLYGTNLSHILVEQTHYHDAAPWPGADGDGASLQRRFPVAYADDPANWTAAVPTPGMPFAGGTPPALLAQPTNATVVANTSASLGVSATGTAPLFYQWRRNGDCLAGATNAQLVMLSAQPRDQGLYDVVVFNAAGSVTSTSAWLNVLIPALIVRQPQSTNAYPGSTITLTVAATGIGQLRYQWMKEGVGIEGATNATFTLTNLQLEDGGAYSVVITDEIGSVTSQPAIVAALGPPVITQHPAPIYQEVLQGGTMTLATIATGTQPLSYKWRRNNITVLYQTNATLRITNAASANAGNYIVIITNIAGSVTSAPAAVAYLADFDRDGMADKWETQYGFATNNAADALQDADSDGRLNGQEYAAGTNPTNPASFLKLDLVSASSPVTLAFTAISNRSYTIEFRNNLAAGSWLMLTNRPARFTNCLETVTDSYITNSRFYRLVIPRSP